MTAGETAPAAIVKENANGVLLLRLNRPKTCNAMNLQMYREINEAIKHAERDPDTKVLVITGTGRYFSSGRDLKERTQERPSGHEYFEQSMYDADGPGHFYDLMMRCRKPIITAINGPAVGGGAITAFLGDISIASRDSYFALTEIERGVTAVGATMVFPRLISRAKGMLYVLTGERCDAVEAERIGLITRVVEPDEVMPQALALAAQIATRSSVAIRMYKTALQAGPWGVSITEDIVRESLRALAETTPERYRNTEAAFQSIGSRRDAQSS